MTFFTLSLFIDIGFFMCFQLTAASELEKQKVKIPEKRKTEDTEQIKDLKKVKHD